MDTERIEEIKDALRALAIFSVVDGEPQVKILGDKLRFFKEGLEEFEYVERAVRAVFDTHFLSN